MGFFRLAPVIFCQVKLIKLSYYTNYRFSYLEIYNVMID